MGGRGNFSKSTISSHIRVQIAPESVRLIPLIDLNMFLIHIISWKPFVWRHTRKLDGLRKIFYDSKDDYTCGITIIRVRVDVCGTDFGNLVSIYSKLRIT